MSALASTAASCAEARATSAAVSITARLRLARLSLGMAQRRRKGLIVTDPDPHSECRRAMEWRDREIHALRQNTELLGKRILELQEQLRLAQRKN